MATDYPGSTVADVYQPLEKTQDPERFIPDTAPWIYLANKPYLDWLFGGAERAREIVETWMHRETSEISIRNVSVLLREGKHIGGIVRLSGHDLVRARKADTLALVRDVPAPERTAVLGRLKAAGHLFVYPGPDEFYLAKMGVEREARGTGVAQFIFGQGIEEGAQRGYRKFRGDVHVDNIAALKLYQSFGFEIVARTECPEAGLSYVSVFLDRDAA